MWYHFDAFTILTKLKFVKEKLKSVFGMRSTFFSILAVKFEYRYIWRGWYMQRTSDTRLNWSISWCNWEIFSALEIDASCKEVRHSRSSRNSLSTPFALASLSAASAPKIFTLSTAPDFTSSISLHLIKSNSWRSKHRCAVLHSPSSLVRDAKDNFRETRKFTHEGWCSKMLS